MPISAHTNLVSVKVKRYFCYFLNKSLKLFVVSTVYSRHICCRVGLSGLYAYGDSNFGVFRFPYDYVNAHKWLDHQISIVFVSGLYTRILISEVSVFRTFT